MCWPALTSEISHWAFITAQCAIIKIKQGIHIHTQTERICSMSKLPPKSQPCGTVQLCYCKESRENNIKEMGRKKDKRMGERHRDGLKEILLQFL